MNVRTRVVKNFTYQELLWFKNRYKELIKQIYTKEEEPTSDENIMNLILHYSKLVLEFLPIVNIISLCYMFSCFLFFEDVLLRQVFLLCSVHVLLVVWCCVRSRSALNIPWVIFFKLIILKWKVRKRVRDDMFGGID